MHAIEQTWQSNECLKNKSDQKRAAFNADGEIKDGRKEQKKGEKILHMVSWALSEKLSNLSYSYCIPIVTDYNGQ